MEEALIWSPEERTWRPSPETPADAAIGLYEALRADVTPEALQANQIRIARSLSAATPPSSVTGSRGNEWPNGLPTVLDGLVRIRAMSWFAFRFEVRGIGEGRFTARVLRRDRPELGTPVRLMPVATEPEDAAYPHKFIRREHLTRWRQAALDFGADDAIVVVGDNVREAATAFVARVDQDSVSFPPLAANVLPSTTREMLARWLAPRGIKVIEREFGLTAPPGTDTGWIWGNAIAGILPAVIVSSPDALRRHEARLPSWLDLAAINATIFTGAPAGS
jgi:amino-transferase class IV